MRLLIILILSLLFLSCINPVKQPTSKRAFCSELHNVKINMLDDTIASNIRLKPEGNYNQLLLDIKKNVRNGKHSSADFEQYLIQQIIPHWYGTEWDFNGYTSTPRKGVIACGYFVSTTLLHLGINLNRYHLAQQAGLNEAKSLAVNEENYETFLGIEKLEKAIEERYEEGVYFVGLDNHVGFLYIKEGISYFIHSNYIENSVMIENIKSSLAFESNVYVVAKLSTNEALLEKWRTGEKVMIYRN